MKPQQQNTDVKGESHVYVQKPNGDAINIPADQSSAADNRSKGEDQTAANTPTTHSKEVTDGEDG